MPIKDKRMSIIRLKPSSQHTLSSLFEDIFYRDKSGALASSALRLYNKIRKEPGIKSSDWQKHISEVFKAQPVDFAENAVLKEICRKYSVNDENPKGLRGKKPYLLLIGKHSNGKLKLDEKELSLLRRVSKWHSAVSSYYSIINKLMAIGLIDKKESSYVPSNKFINSLKSIEKTLQQ